MQEGQIVPSSLLVAGSDSSRTLEPMKETLNAVSNRIQPPVIAVNYRPRRVGWDHHFHATRRCRAANRLGVVASVADEGFALRMDEELWSDGDLVLLAGRQLDVKRASSAVDDGVDLRRESTS